MRTAHELLQEAQAILDRTPVGDSFALRMAVAQRDAMQLLVDRQRWEVQ